MLDLLGDLVRSKLEVWEVIIACCNDLARNGSQLCTAYTCLVIRQKTYFDVAKHAEPHLTAPDGNIGSGLMLKGEHEREAKRVFS